MCYMDMSLALYTPIGDTPAQICMNADYTMGITLGFPRAHLCLRSGLLMTNRCTIDLLPLKGLFNNLYQYLWGNGRLLSMSRVVSGQPRESPQCDKAASALRPRRLRPPRSYISVSIYLAFLIRKMKWILCCICQSSILNWVVFFILPYVDFSIIANQIFLNAYHL